MRELYSNCFESFFWGIFPKDAIFFKAGGWPESGGGVVLPSRRGVAIVEGKFC